jgi:lysophospholipase L1-like esterase
VGLLTPPRPLRPRLQVVATRGQVPINWDGPTASNYTRYEGKVSMYIGPQHAHNVQVVYVGFAAFGGLSQDTITTNDISVECQIISTTPSLRQMPVSFYGQSKGTFASGVATGMIFSDPLGFEFAAGSELTVRTGMLVASGGRVPGATGSKRSGEAFYASNAGTSQVYSNASFALPSGGVAATYGVCPLMLVGLPEKPTPSVCIWGDSNAWGTGQGNDGLGNGSWIERGLFSVNGYPVPYVNISRSGDTIQGAEKQFSPYKRSVLPYVSHVICALGTNDVGGGTRTLADMQASAALQWAACRSAGCKVYQSLLTPHTADATNAALFAGYSPGGLRDQFNAWIKTQVGTAIDGYLDANTVLENGSTGFWANASYTADGLHLSPTGAALAKDIVTAWAQPLSIGHWA